MQSHDVRGPLLCEDCRYNMVEEPTDWNGEHWWCLSCYRQRVAALKYGAGRF